MVNREIKFPKDNSFFLFGARRTGKTYLVKKRFEARTSCYIDLLDQIILGKDVPNSEAFCLSRDPLTKKIGAVSCLPWQAGLVELGL